MRGLALEGGGAKGAYQIGVYKALVEEGYTFHMVAGTSIGSVNAALIAQGDFKLLENLWLEIKSDVLGLNSEIVKDLVNHNISVKLIKGSFNNLKSILKTRGIDTTNFIKLLEKYIDEEKVRSSRIKFGLVTMCLSTLKPMEVTIDEIPKGKLIEYIMASCYLPVFNMKKIIDDSFYIDGGFTNVLPITLLERCGCNEIIGVRIKKFGLIKKPKNKKTKVTLIQPKKNIGAVILLEKERCITNMKLGYYDALKVIKNLDGNKFYFKHKNEYLYRYISRSIPMTLKHKLKKKYHVKTQKELIIKLLEKTMEENNFQKMFVYDPWKVIKVLKKKYALNKITNLDEYILELKTY